MIPQGDRAMFLLSEDIPEEQFFPIGYVTQGSPFSSADTPFIGGILLK
jgi:hypothetical protein